MAIRVGVRTARIGSKSISVEQSVQAADSERLFADGSVVLVAYDYSQHATIPVPARWRQTIEEFESGGRR